MKEDYNSAGILTNVRFFIIRLFAGKSSIILNCRLVSVRAIVNNRTLIGGCTFNGKKNVNNLKRGTTLRPLRSRGKKVAITLNDR